jgi:hypothetical protein
MGKIEKVFSVDDEIVAVVETLKSIAIDVKAKAPLNQVGVDAYLKLSPALATLANIASDVKANPDNRAFIAAGLEQLVEALLL